MEGWAKNELEGIHLGDKRLNRRACQILETLGNKPDLSINAAFSGWAETKAAYRFFDHLNVSPEKILTPHFQATQTRSESFSVFLHIQDTTQFNYSHRKEKIDGLGQLRMKHEQGFFLHPTLAFSSEGICLGVIHHSILVRETLMGPSIRTQSKPIQEKESMRWIESYRVTQDIAFKNPNKTYINITDREGDFYQLIEQYDALNTPNAHLLIRAKKIPRLIKDTGDGHQKLWQKIESQPVQGRITFPLKAIRHQKMKNREARDVTQEIRFCKVEMGPPQKVKRYKVHKEGVEIYGILCTEGTEQKDPIEWMLLTTMAITTQEEALRIVQYYIKRWQIELYFKVLKSGCRIEELQLENLRRLENSLAIYMVVAWRILFLSRMGRYYPEESCDKFYEKEEWETAWQVRYREAPPREPPSLSKMNEIVAEFGGFLHRKSDGEPGIQVIWIGLQKLRFFVIAYASFTHINSYG